MDDLLNNIEEIKGFMGKKSHSDENFPENVNNRSNGSLSSRLNKQASSFHQLSHQMSTFSASKNLGKNEMPSTPSFGYQITIGYIVKFLEVLHRKFKLELTFHKSHSHEISNLRKDVQPRHPELEVINHMLHFDCFTIINKKENPHHLKVESIIERIQLMITAIEEAQSFVRITDMTRQFSFSNEIECKKNLLKVFPDSLFQNEYFCIICSEMWRFIRQNRHELPSDLQIQVPFENLKLFIYGISFPTCYLDDFPLHQAVYTSNLPMIRRICARENSPIFYSHVEQGDPAGVTALMLAVLLGNKDAALILTNHGADPKHRSYPYARTPFEEAIKKKKRGIIKTLLLAHNSIRQTRWENNKKALIRHLNKLPDFSFEMSWECDSKIIPFVKRIAPSDTYKVYKLGSSLRIDLSLLGWSKFQSVRGNSSIVFNANGMEEGKLVIIDNSREVVADVFEDINGLTLENKIDELIKHEQLNSEFRAENVVFKPVLNWKGEPIVQTIENYPAKKCHAKGTFSLMFTKRNILVDISVEISNFKSFKDYFGFALKEPLWIFQENSKYNDSQHSPIGSMLHYIECYQAVVKNIFDKDDTSKAKDTETDKSMSFKTKKEIEKISMTQKQLLKNYSKNVVATVYMCETFPLNLDHLMPVLEILSNVSPHINKLKGFLEKQSTIDKNSFPLKACIPIFLSVNANLCTKNFKFTPPDTHLFDFEKALRRKSIPKKKFDINFKEDKLKTEGGSDDEQAKKCWEDLLKNSEEDILPYNYGKTENKEPDNKYSNGELDESVESTKPVTQSFFKKNKPALSVRNNTKGLIREESANENLEDCEISEKYNEDSLRLNSHPTYIPKTISSIEQKFSQYTYSELMNPNPMYIPEDHKVIKNIHTLKARNSYKFLESLNTNDKNETARTSYENMKDSNRLDRDSSVFENNVKDSHMKKMLKYALRHNDVAMSQQIEIDNRTQFEDEKNATEEIHGEEPQSPQQNLTKKGKHPRIKSADLYSQNMPNPLSLLFKK